MLQKLDEDYRTFRGNHAVLMANLQELPASRQRSITTTLDKKSTAVSRGVSGSKSIGDLDADKLEEMYGYEIVEALTAREEEIIELEQEVRKLRHALSKKTAELDIALNAVVVPGGEEKERDLEVKMAEGRLGVLEQEVLILEAELRAEKEAGKEIRRELAARVLQTAQLRRSV